MPKVMSGPKGQQRTGWFRWMIAQFYAARKLYERRTLRKPDIAKVHIGKARVAKVPRLYGTTAIRLGLHAEKAFQSAHQRIGAGEHIINFRDRNSLRAMMPQERGERLQMGGRTMQRQHAR